MNTLGSEIFSDIESNEYLQEHSVELFIQPVSYNYICT